MSWWNWWLVPDSQMKALAAATAQLKTSTAALKAAILPYYSFTRKVSNMASPIPQAAIDQITATDTVIASATALINNIATLITNAVNAAIANGATAAELQPVSDAVSTLKTQSDALAAAVAANTPAAP